MPTQVPFYANTRQQANLQALALKNLLESGNVFVFVSHYDPWFKKTGSQWYTSVPSEQLDYPDLDSNWEAGVRSGIIGLKKIRASDVSLVLDRNNDSIGGIGQPLPSWDNIKPNTTLPFNKDQIVTSENPSENSIYVYKLTDVVATKSFANTTIGASGPLASAINLPSESGIFLNGTEAIGSAFLLYKISGDQMKFVTDNYIPIQIISQPNSIQAIAEQQTSAGQVLAIHVQDGGTGYTDGSTITFSNANGIGFTGTITAIGGVIKSVHIDDAGYGYYTADNRNIITIASAHVDAATLIPVFAGPGLTSGRIIEDILPTKTMVYSQFITGGVDETPFRSGMHGYTIGIISSPMQRYSNTPFTGQYGRGFVSVTFNIKDSPGLAYSLSSTRVNVKIKALAGTEKTDWLDASIIPDHFGDLLYYEVTNALSGYNVTLYFCDQSTITPDWSESLTQKYDICFELKSVLSNGEIDITPTENMRGVVLAGKNAVIAQEINLTSGSIMFVTRSSLPNNLDPVPGWTFDDNLIREFRLVVAS
jgi:hypothetical protein